MIRAALIYALAFAATVALCLVIREAVPDPAGAVLIGVLMGIVCAVPTALLAVLLLRGEQ